MRKSALESFENEFSQSAALLTHAVLSLQIGGAHITSRFLNQD